MSRLELSPLAEQDLIESFSIGNYVIYYRPAVDGIRVARIVHGARDHDALL
jgi:plasmid stabilization system protein ParE